MNKETFIKYMERLVDRKKKEENLNKALREFDQDFNYLTFSSYETLIVDLLKECMDDHWDWISWWLYENECGTRFDNTAVTIDGKDVPSSSLEDLYNLIIKENTEERVT